MKKLLKPKELLLLGLAHLLDLFEEVKDPFGIAANSYKQIYGWVPRRYKRHNFGRLVKRELNTGNIEKVEKNGSIYIRITRGGKEKIKRDYPMLALSDRKWDGKWRIVIFDIAETSKIVRESIRLKLKELGFGMLQKSVWVSPHDVIVDFREYIRGKGLEDSVFAFETSYLLAGDPRTLAEKIWKLNEINQQYEEVFIALEKLKRMYIELCDRNKQYTMEEKMENEFTDLKIRYLQVLLSDPFLPSQLLPMSWSREKTLSLIKSF